MTRLRIAPSPTGNPHIGTIYQALFNFAYAKKYQGKFIVRIEDTDRARFVEGAEDSIFESLDWFGLIEDESPRKNGEFGPYRQSERLDIYHSYAQELLDKGHAYYSYYQKQGAGVKKDYSQIGNARREEEESQQTPTPPQSIAEMITKGDWVIRMRVPQDKPITFHDEIRGEITFEADQVTEQVLIKSDGFPTYHLAVVVDDHLMKISHVVRGEEWISSTPKHVLLYDYFGWKKPLFCHTPDLRNPDKSKLSKRHGHTNVNWYKDEGFLPEALINFLALLGWSHPNGEEIFTREEFIQLFDMKDLKPVGPVFDLTKLTWINQQYIQAKSDEELLTLLLKFFPKAQELSQETIKSLLPLVKSRMPTLKSFGELTKLFFTPPPKMDDELSKKIAGETYSHFEKLSSWTSEDILLTLRNILTEHKVKMSFFYKLFTGEEKGLPLPEALQILGKEKTLRYLGVHK